MSGLTTRERLQMLADGPLINAVGRGPRDRGVGPSKRKMTEPRGYFMQPGTGPAGETCKTCKHICRVQGGRRKFRKCKLAESRWTHGPGSDIKAGAPACRSWERPPVEERQP